MLGALTAAAHVAPAMRDGTILITAAFPEPLSSHTSLSLGTACVRALTEILADEFPHVRVATVLRGDAERTAEECWSLHAGRLALA